LLLPQLDVSASLLLLVSWCSVCLCMRMSPISSSAADVLAVASVFVTQALPFACHLAGTEEMSFTAALHTYFKISAIGNVSVSGLDGITYTDSLQGGQSVQQSGDVIFDQEVDRIYLAVPDSGVQVCCTLVPIVALLMSNTHKGLRLAGGMAVQLSRRNMLA
jgi:D-hexose-6-phosphate mutarotase